jgi:AraC family transcriptional regulator, regulatory protein of adaptative response / methylated-DNA-[protein]-cysteine methyltransferase
MSRSGRQAQLAAGTINDQRWRAVVARDASADETFVYSVRTTGVYCRPSCSARPARPENVQFHATSRDAAAAGFRPCKRCTPDHPSLLERRAAAVTRACRRIEASDQAPSPFHFHRVFRAVTGLTPRGYAIAHRDSRVRRQLERSDTVTQAIYESGYNSNGRFYAKSDAVLGMTPTVYRAGGATAEIRFAIGECSLGAILVARSDRGVCAIMLGDDPDALARDLQQRFPQAELIGGDAEFEELVAKVVGLVEVPGLGLDLPLDVQGTAFQQRVWEALREIPAGRTATYGEIAARIGAPKAVRAVAGACAANPLAVAIPCHRVVRTDGSLSGYRWGVERKRALLGRESGS